MHASLLRVLLAISCTLSVAQEALADADHLTTVWHEYRAAFPYLNQGIAVWRGERHQCVVIVSEPPPSVTKEQLHELVPSMSFKKHPLGADGWLVDGVAELTLTDAQLSALVGELHDMMYGSRYKAYVIDIPATSRKTQEARHLDLKLRSDDVLAWVGGTEARKPVRFAPLFGGVPVTFKEIKDIEPLVFVSEPQGLVGWWIPKARTVSQCMAQVRQFVLESDLIIGAAGDERGVLIVGRQRSVPYEILPPLRLETIALLGNVRADELMQTINPQALSCYINDNPTERWELNLLSPVLYDTEFGALLTISDVLLKSWSLNGANSVRGFREYPQPATWAFQKPLLHHLGSESLVFNYNSATAAQLINTDDGIKVYGAARTSVLPIAYFPDHSEPQSKHRLKVSKAEQVACDWFGSQSDPHLVRVVQYTILLQVFNAFDVKTDPGHAPQVEAEPVRNAYLAAVRDLLDSAAAAKSVDARRALVKRMSESVGRRFVNDLLTVRLLADPMIVCAGNMCFREVGLLAIALSRIAEEMHATEDAETWIQALAETTEEARAQVAKALAGAAPTDVGSDPSLTFSQWLASAMHLDEKLGDALSRQSEESAKWMHSPVVIYDHNLGSIRFTVGGHNLRIPTVKFRADKSLEAGSLPRGIDGTYRVNPVDLGRILVRGGKEPELISPAAAKPLGETLGLTERARIMHAGVHGWARSVRSFSTDEKEVVKVLRGDKPDAVIVIRRDDGTLAIDNGRIELIASEQADAIDAIVDTLSGRDEVHVRMTGMNAGEVDAMGWAIVTRRRGRDMMITAQVGRREPINMLAKQFELREYKVDNVELDAFEIVGRSAMARLRLPTATNQELSGRIDAHIRAGGRGATFLRHTKDLIIGCFQRAWRTSATPKELKAKFTNELRQDLLSKYPDAGTEFLEYQIDLIFRLRLEDFILSDRGQETNHEWVTTDRG